MLTRREFLGVVAGGAAAAVTLSTVGLVVFSAPVPRTPARGEVPLTNDVIRYNPSGVSVVGSAPPTAGLTPRRPRVTLADVAQDWGVQGRLSCTVVLD